MVSPIPLFGPVGPEVLVILLVLVLLFGANKIPKLARSTGQAMGEFKKGREDIEDELKDMADPDSGSSDDEPEPDSVFDDEESVFDEETETTETTETAEATEKNN